MSFHRKDSWKKEERRLLKILNEKLTLSEKENRLEQREFESWQERSLFLSSSFKYRMTDDDESKVFSLRQWKEGENERRDKGMNIFERFTTRSILNTWGKTLREQCSKRISCAVSMRENSRGLEEERPPMNVFLSVCVFSPRGYMNGFLVSSYNCSINTLSEIEEERVRKLQESWQNFCVSTTRDFPSSHWEFAASPIWHL